ncbi:cytochrome P450 [Mycobacterium sp. 852002-51961_SCH5331710]|uniref:cytochrome P450 n=1 Tax=Mycobacterium sp. 852002-51961_SCH5331710 TaxID=1834105 RepID=UPI0007FCFCAF|nr:cytochrome P450 [Mycobacterium sp. 852002-51961_SCH5331710]OBB45988.1 cytochrome [Mycobacterium sp. 852002-51961_SCH5331710]
MNVVDGELGIALFEDRFIQDPQSLYARMHQTGPVHRIGDSGFFAVSGWDAVNEAVARCDDFSSNLTATMTFQNGSVSAFPMGELGGPMQVLATADDPAHAIHRKTLLPQLAAKRIRDLEPFIADTSAGIFDSCVRGGEIDWMAAMANRLPMMVVCRIIGVPDSDVDMLTRLGYSATQFVEGLVTEEQLAAAGKDVMELGAYITEQFGQASPAEQDNLLGDLAAACAEGVVDHTGALAMLITLFSAGGESTASLIGSAAWILATQKHIQHQLRDRPELLGAFLEEVLRFEPPFRGHYRHVARDTELGGAELPAGSRLLLLWGAANRDPAHFDEPDTFRLDRVGAKGHIAFGKGAHFCVGASLARLEARIVIGQLIQRTSTIDARDIGRWLPSLLVRRLERLDLVLAGDS